MRNYENYSISDFEDYFKNKINEVILKSAASGYGPNKRAISKSYKDLERKVNELELELARHPMHVIETLNEEFKKVKYAKKKFQELADKTHLYYFQGCNGNLLYCPVKPKLISEEKLKQIKESGMPTCGWEDPTRDYNYRIRAIWHGVGLPKSVPGHIPGNWRDSLIEPKEPGKIGWDGKENG